MKNSVANLIVCICLLAPSVAGAQIYKDSNGYFAAIPPSGWKQQDFPSETVRSKVAFNHPQPKGPGVRIIAGPVPRSGYSLDDLLAENKEKIDTLLKPKFPGGVFSVSKKTFGDRETVVQKNSIPGTMEQNIVMYVDDDLLAENKEKIDTLLKPKFPGRVFSMSKKMFGDREAVVQRNSIPGTMEQKIVMYVNKDIWYSIAFSASSQKEYESVTPIFQKFLNSFTILETGREFSDAERKGAVLAKYKRLAEIFEQSGNTAEALGWVQEGLEVDPNNKELSAIQARLTKRQK